MRGPSTRRPMHRARLPLLALAALAAACDAGTGPEGAGIRLVPTSGIEQRGLANEPLPDPLVVRVVGADGVPVPGAGVTFRAGEGSGSIEVLRGVTNEEGTAVARWTLGFLPNQEVVASAAGFPDAAATFTASLLSRAEADLIVLSGQGNTDVSLIAYDAGAFDPFETYRAIVTDSILVLPFAHPAFRDEVAAFARGRPPALVSPVQWRAGRRDTVTVSFRDPVEIPITIWIVKGPYERQAELARTHARAAEEVWGAEGMGIRFSEVEVRDATGHPRAADFHGLNLNQCATGIRETIGRAPGRVNIYYVGGVAGFGGFTCSNEYVMMAEQSGRWRHLLAHELGHTFGLSHERFGTENVMNPIPGPKLTSGQIFHAHFQTISSLNAVYATYPAAMQRECRRSDPAAPAIRPCMPASYDLF